MIFHIDADSFYAACECLFRPDLEGKPIAVLSNNDGITIALNRQCKELGFHRGDVFFKYRDEYRKKGVIVFSSNYTLYADISRRLNLVYRSYSPDVEQYSIDESFLLFPDWNNTDYIELGQEIRATVRQQIHVPVSIGIAPTKTLAKLCNRLAKEYGGVCDWNKLDQKKILEKYPVGEVWGIGNSKRDLLVRHGIKTALDLSRLPLAEAKKYLTITGYRTVRELNGIESFNVAESAGRQNITTSRSFAGGVTNITELETALAEYTQIAVTRMRSERSVCKVVSVKLMTGRAYNPKNKSEEYIAGKSGELSQATGYLPDILKTATGLLREIYRSGYRYRKLFVGLFELEPAGTNQTELFETTDTAYRERTEAVMAACDKICGKYGAGIVHTGIRNLTDDVGKDGRPAAWIVGRAYLSPEYTTKLSDIPKVF